MKALSLILLLVAALMLPVWPYSQGWNYYFSGIAVLVGVAFLLISMFRRKNGEAQPKASRTQEQPEFIDDGISSYPRGTR
jgi:hypothetical protein